VRACTWTCPWILCKCN